jgi:hypothetical protein
MCGIGGFSLHPQSKINARLLSNALLRAAEIRGHDASGFAYASATDRGFYKKDVTGSQLSLKALPRNAKTVILHTRAATHGTHRDMENNHPVQSGDGNILLTHNGVIFNHDEIKHNLGVFGTAPEVDTAAASEAVALRGPEEFAKLEGWAAFAWLDDRTKDVLHLARPSDSPVAYCWLLDGSFVYASTQDILATALIEANLDWIGYYPEPFAMMETGEYFQIQAGNRFSVTEVGWGGDGYTSAWYSNSYRARTSGIGSGFGSSARYVLNEQTGMYEKQGYDWEGVDAVDDDYDYDTDMGVRNPNHTPLALTEAPSKSSDSDKFYLTDHDGDYEGYRSIEVLAAKLRWENSQPVEDHAIFSDGATKWLNRYSDIGHIEEDGGIISWLFEPDLFIDEFSIGLDSADKDMILDGLSFGRALVM